jgi:hypothetical protein
MDYHGTNSKLLSFMRVCHVMFVVEKEMNESYLLVLLMRSLLKLGILLRFYSCEWKHNHCIIVRNWNLADFYRYSTQTIFTATITSTACLVSLLSWSTYVLDFSLCSHGSTYAVCFVVQQGTKLSAHHCQLLFVSTVVKAFAYLPSSTRI